MQANPNNQTYSKKMLLGIAAMLAAGSLGGVALSNITTPRITTGTFAATSTLLAPNIVTSSTQTGTLQVNGGAVINKHLAKQITMPTHEFCNQGNEGCGPSFHVTSTLLGALPGDSYVFSPSPSIAFGTSNLLVFGNVTTDTVDLWFDNTGSTTTVATTTFNVDVWGFQP